jgi:hypothetical protein
MANEKLIRASEARKAILDADPKLAYCIDNIKAVDAVEVVRCKVCHNCTESNWCTLLRATVRDDDFCSYGERREGE